MNLPSGKGEHLTNQFFRDLEIVRDLIYRRTVGIVDDDGVCLQT